MQRYFITCGDINGIGPEIILKALNKFSNNKINQYIVIIPRNIFDKALNLVRPDFEYKIVKSESEFISTKIPIIVYALDSVKLNVGKPTKSSGQVSYNSLLKAIAFTKKGLGNSMITAPISKHSLKLAGYKFGGHTEYLAEEYTSKNVAMVFLSQKIKCSLLTIHTPLKEVSKKINQNILKDHLELIIQSLKKDLGIKEPSVAVLGVNPHAGEEGNLGLEEKLILKPIIKKYKNIDGPFVPDAFFANKLFMNYDLVVGMYHDQVLIPFKYISFDKGVNFTAGLPIVRTSPDHGAAYDIAWQNKANPNSMIESFIWAKKILSNRKHRH